MIFFDICNDDLISLYRYAFGTDDPGTVIDEGKLAELMRTETSAISNKMVCSLLVYMPPIRHYHFSLVELNADCL